MVFLDTPLVVASKSHQGVLHDVPHDVPHNVPLEFCMSVMALTMTPAVALTMS